jgi:hypothetical protein
MSARYTPVEIIAGGERDTRETFAELYVELAELRQEAASCYYRAFVDPAAAEGPAFHPAPAGFGGNELARPARRVDLSRLTGAGLALYAHGVRAALDSVNEASSRPNPPITTPLDDCPSGRARIVPRAGVCASDSLSITRVDNAEAVPLRVFHDDVVSVCRSTSPMHLTST